VVAVKFFSPSSSSTPVYKALNNTVKLLIYRTYIADENHWERNEFSVKASGVFLIILHITNVSWSFVIQNPAGHHEALMGNAGVAAEASEGNPLFNPAGLAFYEDPSLNFSLSGTLVNTGDSSSNLYQKSNVSVTSQTLMSSANFPIGYGIRMAPFYSFPQSSDFYGYTDSTTGGQRARQGQELRVSSAIGGLAYAGQVTANVAWGFSVAATWDELELNQSLLKESTGASDLLSLHDLKQNSEIQVMPGFLWRVNDSYSLGVTGTLTALSYISEGSRFSQSQQSGQQQGAQSFSHYDPNFEKTSGASLGQNLRIQDWRFLFDVNYFNRTPLSENPAWQTAFGLRKNIHRRTDLLAGFNYLQASDYSQYFATGGVLVSYNVYEFVLGISYKRVDSSKLFINGNTFAFIFSSSLGYTTQ